LSFVVPTIGEKSALTLLMLLKKQ